jgi:hypothetical protein
MVSPLRANHHATSRQRIPMLVLRSRGSRIDLPQTLDSEWDVSIASTLEEALAAVTAIRRHRLAGRTVVLMDSSLPFARAASQRIRALLPNALFLAPAPVELMAMRQIFIPTLDIPLASRSKVEAELARRSESA